MSNVSLQNNAAITPQQQITLKKQANQPEFSAVDKDKIKQDAVELAQQGHQAIKENWIFSTLRNVFHIEDPKKFLTSLGLTLATVVGLAYIGNKSVNKMADLGQKVDDILAGNKLYQNFSKFFSGVKEKTVSTLKKSKTLEDILNTFKNRKATPKADLTRGYGGGFGSIFSLTPVDTARTLLGKNSSTTFRDLLQAFKSEGEVQKFIEFAKSDSKAALEVLTQTVGDKGQAQQIFDGVNKGLATVSKLVGKDKAPDFFYKLANSSNGIVSNKKFCLELTDAIYQNFGLKNKKELLEFLKVLKKGETYKGIDLSEFTGITMNQSSNIFDKLVGSWWPVNAIDKIGKGIFKSKWKEFGKGNLGDSLIKFNIVNSSLADTKIGSLIQKSILIPTESISNFVNDKSGLGAFLCASIMSLYNNVQDAPKDKKVATIADDYIGTMGAIAISTPMAFATTYGLASLKNLEGKTITSKALKNVGKFFGMGLDKIAKDGTIIKGTKNPIIRLAGGALRFVLIMFVFQGAFSKPIRGAIHKVFGKPYNKAEEEAKAQYQAQIEAITQQLGMTPEEYVQKIHDNPQVIERLQNDPKLAEAAKNNPKILADLLNGKEISFNSNPMAHSAQNQRPQMSPYNTNFINNKRNTLNAQQPTVNNTNINTTKPIDTATYIPSSEFIAPASQYSQEQMDKISRAMQNADKALKNAEKYI